MIEMYLTEGKRTRTVALTDTKTTSADYQPSFRFTEADLIKYLAAKAEYERWQRRLRRMKRYGW
jgi:hypothetical protein